MLRKYENIIFDLDGTLINSSEEVLSCFEKAFKATNYPIETERLTSDVIGPPLKQIISLLAPELTDENKINEIVQNFRQIYDYDENDISVLYKGISELLYELKLSGKRIFLATFKPTIPTRRIVKKFFVDNIFEDVYTIDKFCKKITKEEMITDIIAKYGLSPSKTVMVGDAASDMQAAKSAGVECIGVLWGYGDDKSELIENATFVVNSVEELVCQKLNSLKK